MTREGSTPFHALVEVPKVLLERADDLLEQFGYEDVEEYVRAAVREKVQRDAAQLAPGFLAAFGDAIQPEP